MPDRSEEEAKQLIAEIHGYADWLQVGMTEKEDSDKDEHSMNLYFVFFREFRDRWMDTQPKAELPVTYVRS